LALSRIGAAAVPALVAVLKGKDKEIRWHAAIVLGDIGDQASVLALIEALKEKDMVFWAAEALGKIGPNARAAVPSLMEALKDTDKAAHYAVAKALKRIEMGGRGQ